jgi:hypothetical protein
VKRSIETGQAVESHQFAEAVTDLWRCRLSWKGGLAERALASASRRLDCTPASFALSWRGLLDAELVLTLVPELLDVSGPGGQWR